MNRKELIQNIIISIILFGLTFIVYLVTENIYLFFGTLVCWIIYMLYMGYTLFFKTNGDIIVEYTKRMKKANKYSRFDKDCVVLLDSLQVLNFRKQYFNKYKEGSIRKSFDLLERQILHNVDIAITYMENYNYDAIRKTEQSVERLASAVVNCSEATDKLRELYDMTVKIDDSASVIDISYVDNLLESLKDVATDENIL